MKPSASGEWPPSGRQRPPWRTGGDFDSIFLAKIKLCERKFFISGREPLAGQSSMLSPSSPRQAGDSSELSASSPGQGGESSMLSTAAPGQVAQFSSESALVAPK